ncbi:hypothetical protein A3F00_05085 [Candidatus Daviesbacteria bacterium RIFCSPHIGHO2_12_FULL_37_11]|uniref:DNA polymerase III delta N-terminal domain-containing protein n=1 Tax=Candidatus Daviesbacteria bacterium RIFCSPHIGHO2_12_FULL_37_11 TaxID=1797777 RepID=A0A1F5K9B1_9BACT|nr:MAG: hypothetical protein A3F00_05085 [Candidatus Daviesbacteria bacterium RIFCSPHIGHO2_12_FULL_37_11]OGE45911.1 MAG: hypothetical protein A3B39_01760 [Candidatus Daviesbacteria bacterium RIFCSPLOWO2_01_FULL_37_10]
MIARLLISPYLNLRVNKINQMLSEEEISPDHPDVLYFPNGSKLGIEQAKQIKKHFLLKPYKLKGKVVILEDSSDLTIEAQNALLKTLEEPPENAVLILGTPSEDKLLPTILSRCQIITLHPSSITLSPADGGVNSAKGIYSSPSAQNDRYAEDMKNLLNSTLEERFEYIGNLKEKQEFLNALIHFYRDKLIMEQGQKYHDRDINVSEKELKDFLKELLQAEEWEAQNVNIRAILEYLMLVIPKI